MSINNTGLVAVGVAIIFAIFSLLYASLTRFSSTGDKPWYFIRRYYEIGSGYALVAIAGFTVLALIPWVATVGLPDLIGVSQGGAVREYC